MVFSSFFSCPTLHFCCVIQELLSNRVSLLLFSSFFFCISCVIIVFHSVIHVRYTLAVLCDLASKQGLTDIGDDHIVAWANEKVGVFIYVCGLSFDVSMLGVQFVFVVCGLWFVVHCKTRCNYNDNGILNLLCKSSKHNSHCPDPPLLFLSFHHR